MGRPSKRKKAGRPRKQISEHEIVRLMTEGFTAGYVCIRLGISKDLLYRRFKPLLERGRALRNGNLQRRQFERAMSGNCSMLVWLGKIWLGQRDRLEQTAVNDPLAELVVEMRKAHKRFSPPPAEDEEAEVPLLPESMGGGEAT